MLQVVYKAILVRKGMPKVIVDGKEIAVEDGMTVMQACELAGAEIPRFCYHEKLAIAGNCRMCLVEVEKAPKPVASCAQPIMDGMVIHTNSEKVKRAREGVLEFMLINHPLDCPICDQGGECDLQDQTMFYGKAVGHYKEEKRSVPDKYMGPLVKTNMTRCIHCTRCVRFLEDVAGTPELGAVERGEDMQISTYVEHSLTSELSGNIIDLCPVGALTSKPYAFKCRSWELDKTDSIDVLDAVGSNIRVDSRNQEVLRILPRTNEAINEEWISDKTRFAYDGLKYQRLDRPMIRQDKKLEDASWQEAYEAIVKKVKDVKADGIGAIAGDMTDVETMKVMKDLLQKLKSENYDCRQDGAIYDNSQRALYTFGTTIEGIEEADLCLMVGCNPRTEAAMINARIRKAKLQNGMEIALIGEQCELNYEYQYLQNNIWTLKQLAEGEHPFCKKLKKAKKPMVILGSGVMQREDVGAVLYWSKRLIKAYDVVRKDWNGFNVLQRSASRVGGLDIGFVPGEKGKSTKQMLSGKMDVLFLLGADEFNTSQISPKTFVVYIGHHGDKSAHIADVILPAAAYTEKSGTYVNTEGRVQRTEAAIFPLGEAKEDWRILAELAENLSVKLPYKSIWELRAEMAKDNEVFAEDNLGNILPSKLTMRVEKRQDFTSDIVNYPVKNFYLTDPISRNSKTMHSCVEDKKLLLNKQAV
jgi:NADH-quinone oxidoreductase subunit G